MFFRAVTELGKGGGGSKLHKRPREGQHRADRSHETERSGRNSEIQPSSFDVYRASSESERLQQEGDRSAFSGRLENSNNFDATRASFEQRETSRLRAPNSSRVSEVSSLSSETGGNYHDTRSHSESDFHSARSRRERGSEHSDNESVSDNSTITSHESESIFDHDERGSNYGSETDYGSELGNNEVQSNIAQHDSVNSDTTMGKVERWIEDVYPPTADDYKKHLWDGRNRLRKERERSEENDRKLKEFLKNTFKKLFKGDPNNQQMNSLIIPMMAGELEQVEGKMAPNPRE